MPKMGLVDANQSQKITLAMRNLAASGMVADNIFADCAITNFFKIKDAHDKKKRKIGARKRFSTKGSGYGITALLEYNTDPNQKWIEGLDQVDLQVYEEVTSAVYDYKSLATAVVFAEEDTDAVKGDADLIGMIAHRTANSISTGIGLLNSALIAVNRADAKTVSPLLDFNRIDPTESRDVGGIDGSVRTWWRNQTSSSIATTAEGFLRELIPLKISCSTNRRGDKPDLILCNSTILAWFKYFMLNKIGNVTFNVDMTKLGFDDIVVYEGMTVLWDTAYPDDYVVSGQYMLDMLNTNYCGIEFLENRVFKVYDKVSLLPNGQFGMAFPIKSTCQTWTNQRRAHGKLHNINSDITVT
jgi:hypothetical protein